MGLVFSDDGGWIAVDDAGNYDHELQMEIDAAAQSSGVAQRDLAMDYRPTLTTGADDKVTASFGPTIADPVITVANLLGGSSQSQGTGRFASEDTATQDLMAAIQKAYTEGNVQLGPDSEPAAAQPTGPVDKQVSDDGTRIFDASINAWVANTPAAATPVQLSPQDEAAQYLNSLLEDLDTRGEISENYETHIRDLVSYYQNQSLTQEQVQGYIDKLGALAVGKWSDSNASFLEDFLQGVHGLFSPQGSGSYTPWLESLDYTPMAETEAAAADITKNLDETAAGAQDVNGFIEGLLKGAMDQGGTWEDALNIVSRALIDNQTKWNTYPGLSGQIGNLQNQASVKQWLHGIYAGFDDATKTRLVEAYPDGGPDLSSDYTVFAKAPEPVDTKIPGDIQTDGGITPTPLDGNGNLVPTPVDSPTGVPIPTTTSSGLFDPFVEDAQRPFGEVYRPFTATQAGYNMPGIQSAYASARAPLSTQYSMQLPDLQVPGEIGLDPKYQSADEFLRSLAGGTGQILRGGDLYSRLQDISGALATDPMAMGMDPRTQLYQKQFGDTTQQASAFAQPFLMATRGSPEARSALTQAIAQAAEQFDYQNPMGVTTAGGGSQGFLGWAMDNNLLGINDMFTAQQRNPSAWTPQAVEARGNVINPTITGSVATNVDPSRPFAWQDPVEYRDPFSD